MTRFAAELEFETAISINAADFDADEWPVELLSELVSQPDPLTLAITFTSEGSHSKGDWNGPSEFTEDLTLVAAFAGDVQLSSACGQELFYRFRRDVAAVAERHRNF